MARSNDYPRMLFHRMEDPVTVHSREEEEKLGAEWSRTIWQPELIPQPDPAPDSEESGPRGERRGLGLRTRAQTPQINQKTAVSGRNGGAAAATPASPRNYREEL